MLINFLHLGGPLHGRYVGVDPSKQEYTEISGVGTKKPTKTIYKQHRIIAPHISETIYVDQSIHDDNISPVFYTAKSITANDACALMLRMMIAGGPNNTIAYKTYSRPGGGLFCKDKSQFLVFTAFGQHGTLWPVDARLWDLFDIPEQEQCSSHDFCSASVLDFANAFYDLGRILTLVGAGFMA
jgi:hypothetical protein